MADEKSPPIDFTEFPSPVRLQRPGALFQSTQPVAPPMAVGTVAGERPASSEAPDIVVMKAETGRFAITGGNASFIVSSGKVVIGNRDAILLQATSIELLLSATIERMKAERINSHSMPELDVLLGAVTDLKSMLVVASPSEEKVGAAALSIRDGLLNWWRQDHAQILDRSFTMGLFAGGLALVSHFGLLPAVTVASLIRGKDLVEAFKAAGELLERAPNGPGGDGPG